MDIEQHKVVRLLPDVLERAHTPQKSGASIDIRVYFREDSDDGHLWGEVAFIDRDTGKLIPIEEGRGGTLPLDTDDAVPWYLNEICERMWPIARRVRTQPPAA